MESEHQPFFSIVTISYNQGSYLENCIKSVINQSFKNFEYIIQDPGSIDDSRKILKNYLNDSRIKIFFEKDFSPGDGLNKGFSKAKGLYYLFIKFADSKEIEIQKVCHNSHLLIGQLVNFEDKFVLRLQMHQKLKLQYQPNQK